jgi:ribosomal protein S18 acetylase RimI-like enzyme
VSQWSSIVLKEDTSAPDNNAPHDSVPTDRYTYSELADIYNQARVDYIVPMPMNGKRMEEYVVAYDIELNASMVAVDTDDHQPNGICMLGIRDDRTWITRLGVIPARRRRRTGQFLMKTLIDESIKRDKKRVQLEVIKGNDPAYRLFDKLGFIVTRELLVIRRPPGQLAEALQVGADVIVSEIPDDDIWTVLQQRETNAAWTEETASLKNAGNMKGLHVTLPSGEQGWVIFQLLPFQLSHFVLSPDVSAKMTQTLIASVHTQYPLRDTKIENVPTDHYSWPFYQKLGYFEAFSRIEMVRHLT